MSEKKRPVVGIMTGQFNEDNSIKFLKWMQKALAGEDIDIRFYFGGVSTLILEQYSLDDIGFGCHHFSLYSYCNYDEPDILLIIFGSINVGQKQPISIYDFVNYLPKVPKILLKDDTQLNDNLGSICINMDNYGGMKECVLHLIHKHNVRKIGYLSGPIEHSDSRIRLRAYKDALNENNIPFDESYIEYGDYENHVDNIVEKMFAAHPDFEAIVSANDEMATAIYRVAKKHGRIPGKDLLVTGFDDISIAAYMEPPLTTVFQDYEQIAQVAADQIRKLLKGEKLETMILPARFNIRASCGCPMPRKANKRNEKHPKEQELLMDNWLNVFHTQMWALVSTLFLRNLQLSTITQNVFFEKLAQQLMHLQTRSSLICLLEEPITMKDGEMLEAPEKLRLFMRQWNDDYVSYDSDNAPEVHYGELSKYIRRSEDGPVHLTNYILFHGRTQYGLFCAEIDLKDALFYETLSLEIGSALFSLHVSLEQQALQQDLEEKNQILDYAASHDELTGILNRTGIMSKIVNYIHENMQDEDTQFLLFMADLDHLKQINDTFGHAEGDSALCAAAEALKKALPEGSPFGRSGGDEFTGIMEYKSDKDIKNLIANVKSCCDQYNYDSNKDYYVNISIGCCPMRAGALPGMLRNAIQKADEKLYEAKKYRRPTVLRDSGSS